MKNYYDKRNGYKETIQKGLSSIRIFRKGITKGKMTKEESIQL